MELREKYVQNGQSLVEFIAVVPLFFIILSGVISMFYLQNRNFIDLEACISMSLSQFLFDQQERKLAKWDEYGMDNKTALKSVLEKSFNPSLAFSFAREKKEGVFLDKNYLQYSDNKICRYKNTYAILTKEQGQFELLTCADKNGYEKTGFSFKKVLDKFPLSLFKSHSTSVYYPFLELTWPQRAALTSNASSHFMVSPQGILFAQTYASLAYPQDNSLFNAHCFMEAFSPQCSLSPYADKMNRAAQDGANSQLFACYTEMTIECAQADVLLPVCLAEGLAEIKLSTQLGRQSSRCPLVNQEINAYFTIIKGKAVADSLQNAIIEASMRKKSSKKLD